jgi:ketosteroid isomerase-like protein
MSMSTKALLSRRAALAATAGISLSAQLDLATAGPNGSAAQLVKLAEMKNSAFMRGDMESWARLTRIASDFTLMQPFGGTASRGFDKSPARLAELARFFRNGVATLEAVHTYGIEGIIVLVMIERQTAEVGGLPNQDWSLRVTEVYRQDAEGWELVHRHADPLVASRSIKLPPLPVAPRNRPANLHQEQAGCPGLG